MSSYEFYNTIGKEVKSLAMASDFVQQMNKVCYAMGQQHKAFTFTPDEMSEKAGVLNFSSFGGFIDGSKLLMDEVANYRKSVFSNLNGVDLSTDTRLRKLLFVEFLLNTAICYVEVPKVVGEKKQVSQHLFDKFIATRNPSLIATWMGSTPQDMQVQYGSKLEFSFTDFSDYTLPLVKLTVKKNGNSVTVPRKHTIIENIHVMPIFASYAFFKGLENDINSKLMKFVFVKDNNQVREVVTTLNSDILLDYYGDTAYVSHMLDGANLFESGSDVNAGISLSATQDRGYIRMPEVGSSKYDASGCRAINYARILKIEPVDAVDRTFINVDLQSCIDSFLNALEVNLNANPMNGMAIYKALTGEDYAWNNTAGFVENKVKMLADTKEWLETKNNLFTTTFLRNLHLFMIKNPQWFVNYTGARTEGTIKDAFSGLGEASAEDLDWI